MEKKDYKSEYFTAVDNLKNSALKQIKNYGKTLDLRQIAKKEVVELYGEDADEEYVSSLLWDKCYCVFYIDKHGWKHYCRITAVRYNQELDSAEVRVEDDDISEWMTASYIDGDDINIYLTIVDFID